MCSKEAREFYEVYRIFQEICPPYQHWLNPRAENAIGEINVRARVLLAHANLPAKFWGFAVYFAVVLDNMFLPYKQGSDPGAVPPAPPPPPHHHQPPPPAP
eukprot:1214214-Rhodomonas_salina.1